MYIYIFICLPFVAFGQGLERIVVTSGSGNGNASGGSASAMAAAPTAMAEHKTGSGAARAAAAVMAAAAATAAGSAGGGGTGVSASAGGGDSGAGAVVTPQLRHKIEKLALDLLKMENEKFSIPALKLLLSCMYVGKYTIYDTKRKDSKNNKSRVKERREQQADVPRFKLGKSQSRIYIL